VIVLEQIYKVFGPRTDRALALAKQGIEKSEIFKDTGQTIALSNVDLSIEMGKTFVVMGLSGSGKSTLLRLINRLITPSSGKIAVDGTDILPLSDRQLNSFRRDHFGMVFQSFALFPHKTVLQNVAYGLAIKGAESNEYNEIATKWINTVGLDGYADSYPEQLSGGMKQRVGLARALAPDPDILLMDEPFSALDPIIRKDMQEQLLELQKNLNKTIVFVTHDLNEAIILGDNIAILRDGNVVQIGDVDNILNNPADDYVSAFTQEIQKRRL